MRPTDFHFISRRVYRRRAAFTLLQLGFTLAVTGALAAVVVPKFSRAQRRVQRQSCDLKLKSIALALDAFKSERGVYPARLDELQIQGYVTDPDALHCPRDTSDSARGYAAGYVIRAPGDAGEMPVVTCPFHEDTGGGNQARLGRFTTQFATRSATLTAASAVQIQRAGATQISSVPAGTALCGGDRIRVGGAGSALITFADGSTASLQSGAQVAVLQSFAERQSGAPLYTVLRQMLGEATYNAHPGSRLDVTTPTATVGARGTRFRLRVSGARPQDTQLCALKGKVALTTLRRTGIAPLGNWVSAIVADDAKLLRVLP